MAGTITKTFVADDVLTAAQLNTMYVRVVTNNDQLVGTPRSTSYNMNGNSLLLDTNGDTYVISDTDDILEFNIGTGGRLFKWDGTGTSVNGVVVTASATTVDVAYTATGSDTNISVDLVPKGSGSFGTNGVEASIVSNMFFSF